MPVCTKPSWWMRRFVAFATWKKRRCSIFGGIAQPRRDARLLESRIYAAMGSWIRIVAVDGIEPQPGAVWANPVYVGVVAIVFWLDEEPERAHFWRFGERYFEGHGRFRPVHGAAKACFFSCSLSIPEETSRAQPQAKTYEMRWQVNSRGVKTVDRSL